MNRSTMIAALLIGSATGAHAQIANAQTANQTAVSTVLTTPVGTVDADAQSVIDATIVVDPAARATALGQLTPQAYSLLPELSLNAIEAQETNVLRYLRDLRGTAETPDGAEVSTEEQGRLGLFVTGGARFGSYDAATDRPEVKNDNQMVMGGVNLRFSPKSLIGVYGGYMNSDVNLDRFNNAQSNQKNWFAGGFGTVGVGPVYVDLWGSYNDLDWNLSRNYQFGASGGRASASTGGRVWAAGAATGLSFSAGNFEIEPFAALRYADIRIDGFDEVGAPAALSLGDIEAKSLRLNLGGRIGTKFEVGNGVIVRPQLRGGWYKEFKLDDPRTLNARFRNAAISTPFGFSVNGLSSEYYNAGAALSISGNGPLSMVVDYDVQFDDEREFHAFSVGARLKF